MIRCSESAPKATSCCYNKDMEPGSSRGNAAAASFVKWAKQLSVVTGIAVGVVVGLIYQPAWWVISVASVLAWLVIEGVLKILPWQPTEAPVQPEEPDTRFVRR